MVLVSVQVPTYKFYAGVGASELNRMPVPPAPKYHVQRVSGAGFGVGGGGGSGYLHIDLVPVPVPVYKFCAGSGARTVHYIG